MMKVNREVLVDAIMSTGCAIVFLGMARMALAFITDLSSVGGVLLDVAIVVVVVATFVGVLKRGEPLHVFDASPEEDTAPYYWDRVTVPGDDAPDIEDENEADEPKIVLKPIPVVESAPAPTPATASAQPAPQVSMTAAAVMVAATQTPTPTAEPSPQWEEPPLEAESEYGYGDGQQYEDIPPDEEDGGLTAAEMNELFETYLENA